MRGHWLIGSIALLIAALAVFAKILTMVDSISPEEASSKATAGSAVLVDVREKAELKDGMAQGASWLATSDIRAENEVYRSFIHKLPKDKLIISYCAVGVRSALFAKKLSEMGYRVANMGGFRDWVRAGLPVKIGLP